MFVYLIYFSNLFFIFNTLHCSLYHLKTIQRLFVSGIGIYHIYININIYILTYLYITYFI